MSDNKSKTGEPDRSRINVHEPYEVRDWARKFGVTEQDIRKAVMKVGPSAAKVAKELGK